MCFFPMSPASFYFLSLEYHFISSAQGVQFTLKGSSLSFLLWRLLRHHLKKKKNQMKSLSRVQLFVTPWTIAFQAPPSMEFSRQEYWSWLPFPYPGTLPNPGIEPRSPTLQADALPSEPPGNHYFFSIASSKCHLMCITLYRWYLEIIILIKNWDHTKYVLWCYWN